MNFTIVLAFLTNFQRLLRFVNIFTSGLVQCTCQSDPFIHSYRYSVYGCKGINHTSNLPCITFFITFA